MQYVLGWFFWGVGVGNLACISACSTSRLHSATMYLVLDQWFLTIFIDSPAEILLGITVFPIINFVMVTPIIL